MSTKLDAIADAEIPPALRRRPGQSPPVVIPPDAPSLGAVTFDGYRAPAVNSRGETPGERSKRRHDKDRALRFVSRYLKDEKEERTLGQIVKAAPADLPQKAIEQAIRALLNEKIITSPKRCWYAWR